MLLRLECSYSCKGIALSFLLVLFLYVTGTPLFVVAQNTDVNIIDLLYDYEDLFTTDIEFYKHGFIASLWSRNFSFVGRKVNMTSMKPDLDKVESCIEDFVGDSDDLFIVLGPGRTEITKAALPALRNTDVVAFGPLTRVPVINMRLPRIGVMYTTGEHVGYDEYVYLNKLMKDMEREFSGVFSVDGKKSYAPDDEEFNNKWEVFVETGPQAVIVLGESNSATTLFIEKLLRDKRTASTDLLLAFAEGIVLKLWKSAVDDGTSTFNGHMFAVSSFPDPSDKRSDMVRKYLPIVEAYFKDIGPGGSSPIKKPGGWADDAATLAGWVAGEILFQALSGFNPIFGRKDFIASLFEQQLYIIEDFVIGVFGGEVTLTLQKAGAVARCNQGSVFADLLQFSKPEQKTYLPEYEFTFSMDVCHRDNLTLYDSAAIVTMNFTDFIQAKTNCFDVITKGQKAGFHFFSYKPKHDMALDIIPTHFDDAVERFQEHYDNKWTNIVTGMVDNAILDISDLAFVDIIHSTANLNKFRRNAVFFAPTMEQQIFVLAEYVSTLPNYSVHAVIRSEEGRGTLEVVEKSLLTFGMTLNSSAFLRRNESVSSQLASSGLTLMIEVEEIDIPLFAAHLRQNQNASVAILYNPFALFYETSCEAFENDTDAAERLFITTNLPHWADKNSESLLVRNYHEQVRDPAAWSPLSLQSFIVGRVISQVVEDLKVVSWDSVVDYFYSTIVLSLDDIKFGPFADQSSVTCRTTTDPNGLDCAQNFGASSITVWPMSRVLDPNRNVLFGPVNPSMEYRLPSTGLTKSQQIAAIVGSLLGALLIAVVVAVLIKCFCTGNANAPKKDERPVTLIFTDIQSSTALWAACPELMPDAVETHHRLIRRLISKYRCYEVKTVGDSFMIACKNPYAAVQLVGDLQRTFLHHDWGTEAFDEAYRDFEERQAEEDADYEPPTARLDAAVYRAQWRGLRVRAGVHTGLSDIRRDEVTKRYDYYGSPSNTAARTESIAHGGQVLLTRAAFMALSTAERAGLDVTSLGAVELRGVPKPVEMIQLNTVPGRAFAKLRLERGNDELDFETSTVGETNTSGSHSETLSPAAENIFTVFKDSLSAFPPDQRLKTLAPFCKQWNVPVPPVKSQKDIPAASHVAKQRLALKIARVVERRQSRHEGLTEASEVLSSVRGSFLRHSSSKGSSFRVSLYLRPGSSYRSTGSGFRSPHVSFRRGRGSSVFSTTSSIEIDEPSSFRFMPM